MLLLIRNNKAKHLYIINVHKITRKMRNKMANKSIVYNMRLQDNSSFRAVGMNTPDFHTAETLSGDTIKIDPNDYKLIPRTEFRGKEVYILNI